MASFNMRLAGVIALATLTIVTGCGRKTKSGKGGGATGGPVETAYTQAGASHGVPSRFMLAISYVESRIQSSNATAAYKITDAQGSFTSVNKGTILTQTAFGIPRATLGLTADEAGDKPEAQAQAYALWIRSQLNAKGVQLNPNPSSTEEKFRWIWELALLHRQGFQQRRNVRVVFAQEVIRTLNEGFVWQNIASGETIVFPKESQEIKASEFPVDGQALFKLDTFRSEINERAMYFPLVAIPSPDQRNHPARIEVIHCPLSLSACLELQNPEGASESKIGAHYVIQSQFNDLDRPLQVAGHEAPVSITGADGQIRNINDAIVIMLAGQSGRVLGGVRAIADPTWLTDAQLRMLGSVVIDVCTVLAQRGQITDIPACAKMGGPQGVTFQRQTQDSGFRWGDIPDFDETVFQGYLDGGLGGLDGATVLEFSKPERRYQAGEEIRIRARFQPAVRFAELERLARCPDQKLVWAPIEAEQVRLSTEQEFVQKLWDSGPNGTGDQFFRIKVYGAEDQLLGWAVDVVHLSGYETKSIAAAAPKYCRRNGT